MQFRPLSDRTGAVYHKHQTQLNLTPPQGISGKGRAVTRKTAVVSNDARRAAPPSADALAINNPCLKMQPPRSEDEPGAGRGPTRGGLVGGGAPEGMGEVTK